MWVDVEAIINMKVENFLNEVWWDEDMEGMEDSTPTTTTMSFTTAKTQRSSAEDGPYKVLRPSPLPSLCPQCFGDNPVAEVGFVSFDGNFQHKCFPTKKDADNKYLELWDGRLFIDDGTIPDDAVSFHI